MKRRGAAYDQPDMNLVAQASNGREPIHPFR